MTIKQFTVLMFAVIFVSCAQSEKLLAKYEFSRQENGKIIMHGFFVKTASGQWQERSDIPSDIPTFNFKEIQGEEGWTTLYDSNRKQYVRFHEGVEGPLQVTYDPSMSKWGGARQMKFISVDPDKWSDKQIATVFGIAGVVLMLIIAFFFPNPTPFQYTIFRIVLALVGGGVGATIPGLLRVESGPVRATGAIAVFVIVYFFSPAQLVAHKPSPSVTHEPV